MAQRNQHSANASESRHNEMLEPSWPVVRPRAAILFNFSSDELFGFAKPHFSPVETNIKCAVTRYAWRAPCAGLVSVVVLSEVVWVLRGAYDYDKNVVVSVLRQILQAAELAVEDPAVAWSALADFERTNADFADFLIGHGNHASGCTETYTFDKKAAHGRYFEIVS
jgi:predicted nucleic-acid-binding protein